MTNNCCQKQHRTTWLMPPERGINSVCHLRHSEIGRRIDLPVKNTGQLCRYTASRINVAHHVLKKFLCCCHGPTASFPIMTLTANSRGRRKSQTLGQLMQHASSDPLCTTTKPCWTIASVQGSTNKRSQIGGLRIRYKSSPTEFLHPAFSGDSETKLK